MSALNPDFGDINDVREAADLRFRVFEKLLSRKCYRAAFNALDFSFELYDTVIELERTNGKEV